MNSTIYYFSGTGNCLKVARDIAKGQQDVRLVRICRDLLNSPIPDDGGSIGFVFPVYFTGIPLMLKELIGKLKLKDHSYIFAIATFGGNAGISLDLVDKLLGDRGAALHAGYAMQMPGNYQVLYAPMKEGTQETCFYRQKASIEWIAYSIRNRERVGFKHAKLVMSGIGSMVYSFFKPYASDKNFWTDSHCTGCGRCSKVCPANNIAMIEAAPQWQGKCEQCLACMQWCPVAAIQYKKRSAKWGRYHHPEITFQDMLKPSEVGKD